MEDSRRPTRKGKGAGASDSRACRGSGGLSQAAQGHGRRHPKGRVVSDLGPGVAWGMGSRSLSLPAGTFEEIARIDSATGWLVQMSNAIGALGLFFGDQAVEEMYAGDTIFADALHPQGTAVSVEGGYELNRSVPICERVSPRRLVPRTRQGRRWERTEAGRRRPRDQDDVASHVRR